MPYGRPTLSQLISQAQQDVNSQLTSADGFLRRSVLKALAYAQAALAWGAYGYIDWLAKNFVPWSATGEYAAAWGALKGVYKKAATYSTGNWASTGTINTPLLLGTVINRSDGFQYQTTAVATVNGGGAIVAPVIALTPGVTGNSTAGTVLTLATPVSGIVASGTAQADFIQGADQETDPSFVGRYLAVYRAPPQGGARQDYIDWALEIGGVTRAWVNPEGMGPGTVVLYTMFDVTNASEGGFPQGVGDVATNETRWPNKATLDLLTVANALYEEQPIQALLFSEAPLPDAIPFIIQNVYPLNDTIQAGISLALQNMFLSLGNVGGTVNPDGGAPWPPIYSSAWNQALLSVPGLQRFNVISPSAPITPSAGYLPQLGTFTVSA